jgi:hypothetical protein
MNEEQEKKIAAFLDEYKALVEKHNVDFANYPMFVPDGQGGFKVIVQSTPVDMEQMSKKSPFIAQENV